jgi:hypothetical protein
MVYRPCDLYESDSSPCDINHQKDYTAWTSYDKNKKDIYLQLLELDKLTHKVELNYSYIDFKPIWATLCLVNTLYI